MKTLQLTPKITIEQSDGGKCLMKHKLTIDHDDQPKKKVTVGISQEALDTYTREEINISFLLEQIAGCINISRSNNENPVTMQLELRTPTP